MIGTYGDSERIAADRIRHGLTDHESFVWIGHHRLATALAASDDELAESVLALRKLAAEAGFAAGDLEAVLDKRREQREADESAAHEQHADELADTAEPDVDEAPDLGEHEAA